MYKRTMNNLVIAGILVTLVVVVLASVCAFWFCNCDKKEKFNIECPMEKVIKTYTIYKDPYKKPKAACVNMFNTINISDPANVKKIVFDMKQTTGLNINDETKYIKIGFYRSGDSYPVHTHTIPFNDVYKKHEVELKQPWTRFRITASRR